LIKTEQFYLDLDLDTLSESIPRDREARLRSEEMGDLITAIWYRCEHEVVSSSDLERWLGKPDRVESRGEFEHWIYEWVGKHGPDEYESNTPFIVGDGKVQGIYRELASNESGG
jgi:hypothetical protein